MLSSGSVAVGASESSTTVEEERASVCALLWLVCVLVVDREMAAAAIPRPLSSPHHIPHARRRPSPCILSSHSSDKTRSRHSQRHLSNARFFVAIFGTIFVFGVSQRLPRPCWHTPRSDEAVSTQNIQPVPPCSCSSMDSGASIGAYTMLGTVAHTTQEACVCTVLG